MFLISASLQVFQCCNASCGRFYHPKCVAGLLEPDGACGLEKRIADGMTFTCPVHWCFECKQIEDRSQTQLWLAVCRRCVRSYHKKCLPRYVTISRLVPFGSLVCMAVVFSFYHDIRYIT